jgi:hypothetical protein
LTAYNVLSILVLKKEQFVRYEELTIERSKSGQRCILLPERSGEHILNRTPGMMRISDSITASLH